MENNVIKNDTTFVIMSKCRQYIAKGAPRNRYLVHVDNVKDKKRILTYNSKGKAESAFMVSGFYTYGLKNFPYERMDEEDYLEAVECNLILTIK